MFIFKGANIVTFYWLDEYKINNYNSYFIIRILSLKNELYPDGSLAFKMKLSRSLLFI